MRPAINFAFCLSFLLLMACAKQDDEAVLSSDANGYLCLDCKNKFYTASTDYAEKCPKCASVNIEETAAYVCPNDQTVMVVPKGDKGARCTVCGKHTDAKKLPSEADLKAWGAAKAPGGA